MNPGGARLIEELNSRTGAGLTLVGIAEHGESGGAVYAQLPDGRQVVVVRSARPITAILETAQVVAVGRSRGLPLPRYEVVTEVDQGTAIVQERMPGVAGTRIDVADLDAMLAINERFAGVLADRLEVPIPQLQLRDGPRHASLALYSKRSRALLDEIQRVDDGEMDGTDLVHLDFIPDNVLFGPEGSVTGVVDWDGNVCRGDRHFALIKLRFELAWHALYPPVPDPAVVSRLDRVLDERIDPSTLRRYWAHWSLKMLDWTIRTAGDADVELHLDLAASRL